jgi:hypothetical protein
MPEQQRRLQAGLAAQLEAQAARLERLLARHREALARHRQRPVGVEDDDAAGEM